MHVLQSDLLHAAALPELPPSRAKAAGFPLTTPPARAICSSSPWPGLPSPIRSRAKPFAGALKVFEFFEFTGGKPTGLKWELFIQEKLRKRLLRSVANASDHIDLLHDNLSEGPAENCTLAGSLSILQDAQEQIAMAIDRLKDEILEPA